MKNGAGAHCACTVLHYAYRVSVDFPALLHVPVAAGAQVHAKAGAVSANAAEHAASLAEAGHCSDALPLLTKTAAHITDRELQERVGLDGVRCASLLQQQEPLLDLLRVLNQHFPHDPEVLYLTVHAYSDLSSKRRAGACTNGADVNSRD
jgi:hypothetical protein